MRRRLRVELRRLRSSAGKTQREVAAELYWSPSKIIRIESGQVSISVTDLRALANLYGVTDEAALAELTELAKGSKRQPFADYRDVLSAETIKFAGYEASASLVRQVQPLVVPGLLQTEEYTRALLKGTGADPNMIDRIVESRRERQEVLDRQPRPEIFVILDEAVLRRAVGGRDVMRNQLHHMRELSEKGVVSIQVLPFEMGAHDALQGPFAHLEFPDVSDPDVLYLEYGRGNSIFTDDLEVTSKYQVTFFELEDMATDPAQFRLYVERAVRSLAADEELTV